MTSSHSDNDSYFKYNPSTADGAASGASRSYLQPPNSFESNVTTFYAFGHNSEGVGEAGEPFDFSPSVNLEDVHRGIIDNDQLSQFPTPGRGVGGGGTDRSAGQDITREGQQRSLVGSSSLNPSVLRRPSISKYSNNQDNYRDRNRRQSNSNISFATSSSTYRKSVATIEPENSMRAAQRRKPSTVPSNSSLTPPIPQKEYIPGSGYSRNLDGSYKIPVSSRSIKSKSLQPPPKGPQLAQPVKTSLTPEHARHSGLTYPPKSPKSPSMSKLGALGKTGIPTSGSSRRISTIPHASGLGARTVSPTDARRLKRLSAIHTPTPPSIPFALDSARSNPGSPSMIPRKSITPSSSGTTPEPQRKSYSSGLSTTSTNTSARTSTGSASLQPKLSQTFAASRLPKPPRTAVEREDEIPPVPPLPKNLASPIEPLSADHNVLHFPDPGNNGGRKSGSGMFGPRKSSLANDPEIFDMEPLQDTSTKAEVREKPASSETSERQERSEKSEKARRTDKETRRKRGMTVGSMGLGSGMQSLEPKGSSSSLRKKDLVPLRLPPLNLLPLSTPTIARVNALGSQSDSEELTPPPKRSIKTPSTPMTASKAGFFGRRDRDEAAYHRSTSSINHSTMHIADSPSSISLRAGSSASSSIPISASSRMGRQTISPYISSSLPKTTEYEARPSEHKSARILGMSLPISRDSNKSRARKSQDSLKNAQPLDDVPDTPSSTSSIRRKLSLSWKKNSSSKHSHAATERADEYQAVTKYDNMPPPKLPPSATWTVPHPPSPVRGPHGPATGGQGRRKSSIGNGILAGQHDHARNNSWGTEGGNKERFAENVEKQHPPPPSKSLTASSILSPMTKMLGSKGSLGQLRSRNQTQPPAPTDPNLDHDDLIAEEEMRRIASKRKNLDAMAQELEELKRRAIPKERISPPQALRTIPLNIYERGEVVDYKEIYFAGTSDAKKHVGDLNSSALPNFGYDDERGDYTIVRGDHLAYRYEIVDVLGKGSFGQVVRCIDHKTGGLVAVKIIRNKKRFHQQALVEVNILQKLKEWVCSTTDFCCYVHQLLTDND